MSFCWCHHEVLCPPVQARSSVTLTLFLCVGTTAGGYQQPGMYPQQQGGMYPQQGGMMGQQGGMMGRKRKGGMSPGMGLMAGGGAGEPATFQAVLWLHETAASKALCFVNAWAASIYQYVETAWTCRRAND